MDIRNNNDKRLWFRIKSIEKRIDKLGPIGCKNFDWLEWERLNEESSNLYSQLSVHRNIVKSILSRYC